jgi:hypothetical protein
MATKHKRGLIRSAKNERMRQQARRLLSKGLLVPSEAAKLAGVSRVLMHLWTKDIDWRAARARSLERAWRNGRDQAASPLLPKDHVQENCSTIECNAVIRAGETMEQGLHEHLDQLLESNRRDWASLGLTVVTADERRRLLDSIRERSLLFWELRARERLAARPH